MCVPNSIPFAPIDKDMSDITHSCLGTLVVPVSVKYVQIFWHFINLTLTLYGEVIIYNTLKFHSTFMVLECPFTENLYC